MGWIRRWTRGEERVLERSQFVPHPRDEVFPFFADAANLQRLTPPWLGFRILTPPPIEMRAGTVIDYRISLRGIPMQWRTLISAWEPPVRFVDEQVRGPYTVWRHEHRFEEREGGTWVTDRVTYAAPGGPWVQRLLIGPELERIFAYRQAEMARMFPAAASEEAALQKEE